LMVVLWVAATHVTVSARHASATSSGASAADHGWDGHGAIGQVTTGERGDRCDTKVISW
jgi:hypothetical protein